MAYNPVYRKSGFVLSGLNSFPCCCFSALLSGFPSMQAFYGPVWTYRKGRRVVLPVPVRAAAGRLIPQGSKALVPPLRKAGRSPPGSVEGNAVVAVSKGEYMSRSYFDDAVFIGDSITHGLAFYGLLDSEQVVASESINLETALYKTPYTNSDGEAVSVADAVKERAPKKVYVMLGTNGIEWTDKENLANMYESLIVKLKEAVPDAIIYIQSVLPVTKELNDNVNRDLTNEKINAFNDLLLELAQKEQAYYLNVAEDFRDSEGNLPEDASPVDGIHFTVAYYQKWIEYLRYHTVEGMSVPEASWSSQSEEGASAAQTEFFYPDAAQMNPARLEQREASGDDAAFFWRKL